MYLGWLPHSKIILEPSGNPKRWINSVRCPMGRNGTGSPGSFTVSVPGRFSLCLAQNTGTCDCVWCLWRCSVGRNRCNRHVVRTGEGVRGLWHARLDAACRLVDKSRDCQYPDVTPAGSDVTLGCPAGRRMSRTLAAVCVAVTAMRLCYNNYDLELDLNA